MKRIIVGAASSLFLILILGGCTFPWEEKRGVDLSAIPEVNNDSTLLADKKSDNKLVSEIVFQEQISIKDLNDFAKEAEKVAIKEIGPEAKLKRIEFEYLDDGDYIAYTAIFLGNDKFLDSINENLFVSYNQKYEIKDSIYQDGLSGHSGNPDNNSELIAMRCSLDKICESIVAYSIFGDIKVEELQISLVNLVKNYEHSSENSFGKLGFISKIDGILKGVYGRYRFKPETKEVISSDDIDEKAWFTNSSDSVASSTPVSLMENGDDSDGDGLTDNDEKNIYKTNPEKADTDGDGYSDGEEIKSGFNPLGPGKLPAPAVEKPIVAVKTSSSTTTDKVCSTDECYGELAVSQKDESICNNIIDHATRGQCLVVVAYKKGNQKPCDVLGNNYPELDDFCTEIEEEIANKNKPLDRDAVTFSDVKQIQTVLELYYNEVGKYPESIVTGSPVVANGNTFISKIPTAKKGETDICATDYEYKYIYKNEKDYALTYCLDHETNKVPAGGHVASPKGIY